MHTLVDDGGDPAEESNVLGLDWNRAPKPLVERVSGDDPGGGHLHGGGGLAARPWTLDDHCPRGPQTVRELSVDNPRHQVCRPVEARNVVQPLQQLRREHPGDHERIGSVDHAATHEDAAVIEVEQDAAEGRRRER